MIIHDILQEQVNPVIKISTFQISDVNMIDILLNFLTIHYLIEITLQVDQMEKNKERTEREIKNLHPLLSRIRPWLKQQLKRADAEHASQHTWDAHIKAIGKI